MKKSIKNKMTMYQMVHDIVKDYQPVWENTPKFVSSFNTFSAKFESMKIQAEKEKSYVLGVKEARDDFRKKTAVLGIRIASALTALAEEDKNLELIVQMRITEAQLNNRSHSDTVLLLDRILYYANIHADSLVPYGISSALLEEFSLKRDELVVTILAPRKAVLKRKDASAQIAQLMEEMDLILKNRLDKLVKVLRPESEVFFNNYNNSRMIMDYGFKSHKDPGSTGESSDSFYE